MARLEKRAKINFVVNEPGRLRVERSELSVDRWVERPTVTCGIQNPFNRPLGALQQDVMHVALCLHIADRCLLRPAKTWSRTFDVTIPVYAHSTWQAVQNELEELLAWLTEDEWHLVFVPMHWYGDPHQFRLFREGNGIALFSGGLDSMAGYVIHCASDERPIPFGVATHPRVTMMQNRVLRGVHKALKLPAIGHDNRVYIRIPVREDRHRGAMGKVESSQRTRGLLYTFLASVLANILASPKVQVYENGVGAVNLPLLRTQFGAMSSRAVHPKTLVLIQNLMERVLGESLTFELPFGFMTKGQMVNHLSQLGVVDLARKTISCDSFPRRMKPCGHCTSCLLSRVALGKHDQPDRYDASHSANSRIGNHAMATHIDRLELAFRAVAPWEALTEEFPELWTAVEGFHLLNKLPEAEIQERLVQMYQAAVAEWRAFETLKIELAESEDEYAR
jgi:hypothetical protein